MDSKGHGAEKLLDRTELKTSWTSLADQPKCGFMEREPLNIGLKRGGLDIGVGRLRNPEVQNLGVPVVGDKDVLWLEVAMNDAALA